MNKLIEHFKRMQECAARYLEPELYADLQGKKHGFETEQNAFIDDMIYMLDGPEQREAQAEASWDYIAETDVTASNMDGRALCDAIGFRDALQAFIIAAERMDLYKKVLFRGRQPSEIGLPMPTKGESLADYVALEDLDLLHGVVGVATESGELCEVILAYTNKCDPIDRVNVCEEIGDELWYLSRIVKWGKTSFDDEMHRNIRKLRARHTETGFDVERDKLRDLDAERAILEHTEITRVGAIERSITDRIYPS